MKEEYLCINDRGWKCAWTGESLPGPKKDDIVYVVAETILSDIQAYRLAAYDGWWAARAFVPLPKITEITSILKEETITI